MTKPSIKNHSDKHFLDTSVLRPMLTASSRYKQFLLDEMSGRKYISKFVKMEFRRGVFLSLIEFFNVLDLPTMLTIDDACKLWSNKFQSRQVKTLLQLINEINETAKINTSNQADKEKGLKALALLIERYAIKLDSYADVNRDTTRCYRAGINIKFNSYDLEGFRVALKKFYEDFQDVETCRSKCRIDTFLLTKHKSDIETYLTEAERLRSNSNTEGFKKTTTILEQILSKGSDGCSCKSCEKTGDAIIALDAPRDMNLEHTDASFNHLCPPINQPHRQHLSEVAFSKKT
jgi:hypothetical protein